MEMTKRCFLFKVDNFYDLIVKFANYGLSLLLFFVLIACGLWYFEESGTIKSDKRAEEWLGILKKK